MPTTRIGIDRLADAIGAAVPDLDEAEQRIAAATYRTLASSGPASPDAIAASVGVSADRVRSALDSWPGVYRDDDDVVGFWGLATAPLKPEYRLEIGGRTLYAWCAWDNLFIPVILDRPAEVQATCPVTERRVSVRVDPDGVREVEPEGAVVSMVIPDGPFGFDVIESFCHRVHFFASRDAGERWAAGQDDATLLSVEEAFELGRRHVRAIMPSVVR